MDVTLSGTVKQILEEQSGTGKNGPWRKQDFILETEGNYPKQVCITQWGENIEQFGISEGEKIVAHVDIASREYNGRWYTDVKAWRVEREAAGEGPPAAAGDEPWPEPSISDLDDDLPF